MKIQILNIGKDKNKILWYIILGALLVAFILIVISMYNITGVKNNSLIAKSKSIFDASKYSAKYNVEVISNKNTNKYIIEEEYKSEINNEDNSKVESFKFITTNEIGDEITYIIENNNLKITSSNQINEYILSNYIVKKRNIFSIATFISLYNEIEDINKDSTMECCAKIETEEYENKTLYRLIFNQPNDNCSICNKYSELFKAGIELKKLELIISNDTNLPVEYIAYDKNNKAYIDIIYEYFEFK